MASNFKKKTCLNVLIFYGVLGKVHYLDNIALSLDCLGLPETESTYKHKKHIKGLTEMAVGEVQHVVGTCPGSPLDYCYAVMLTFMLKFVFNMGMILSYVKNSHSSLFT